MTATRESELKELLDAVKHELAQAYGLVTDAAQRLAKELPDERPEDCTDETTELVAATAERLTLMHLAATAPDAATLLRTLLTAAQQQGLCEVVDGEEAQSALAGLHKGSSEAAHYGTYL